MGAVDTDGEAAGKQPAAAHSDLGGLEGTGGHLQADEPPPAAVVHEDVRVVGMLVDGPTTAHSDLLIQA